MLQYSKTDTKGYVWGGERWELCFLRISRIKSLNLLFINVVKNITVYKNCMWEAPIEKVEPAETQVQSFLNS